MHDEAARAARTLFESDCAGIERLHALLLEERDALARRDIAALETSLAGKTACLKSLAENDTRRQQLLRRHGAADWATLLARTDDSLLQRWQSIQGRLREVAELGETNERIVNRSRRSTARLLSLLRGQADTAGVYDRAGRTQACGDNRPIASA